MEFKDIIIITWFILFFTIILMNAYFKSQKQKAKKINNQYVMKYNKSLSIFSIIVTLIPAVLFLLALIEELANPYTSLFSGDKTTTLKLCFTLFIIFSVTSYFVIMYFKNFAIVFTDGYIEKHTFPKHVEIINWKDVIDVIYVNHSGYRIKVSDGRLLKISQDLNGKETLFEMLAKNLDRTKPYLKEIAEKMEEYTK